MKLEYFIFTKEDPIIKLKSEAKSLSIGSKFKVAPHIKKCEAMMRKCKNFREVLLDDNPLSELVGSSFVMFFDNEIDKDRFVVIPRNACIDFLMFFGSSLGNRDDKYIKKAQEIIVSLGSEINYFIRAFHSIRTAQGEIDKLKKT